MATVNPLQMIWPQLSAVASQLPEYSRLLEHFTAFCTAAGIAEPNATFATKDLAHTLALIAKLRQPVLPGKSLADMTRRELVDILTQNAEPSWRRSDEASVTNALCLALSLWLTLDIAPSADTFGIHSKLHWGETTTIKTLLTGAFPKQTMSGFNYEIDARLTLEYLESYHGFRIDFTDNLAQHLHLSHTEGGSKPLLLVYWHKIWLWNELRHTQVSPLPQDLVGETLDTLNLLLPYNDHHAEKFLEKRKLSDIYGLAWCGRPAERNLDLGRYKYWGERLVRLSNVVAKGPSGMRQLKPGRGPGAIRDFFNFWVAVVALAILTIGFGTASVWLAAMQYELGKQQYDIAVVQYRLSLAQACATMNSTQLPGWC